VAKKRESGFSIELNSKNLLDVVSINEKGDRVLIEGRVGELEEIDFLDDSVLIVSYSKGVLRLDIKLKDIQCLVNSMKKVEECG
jgi:hypothetical protein